VKTPDFDQDRKASKKRKKFEEEEKFEDPVEESTKVWFDPDGDGFYISDEDAVWIHFRIRILYYIWRVLVQDNSFASLYNSSLTSATWTKEQDLDLVAALGGKGFAAFPKDGISAEDAEERARDICDLINEKTHPKTV
jgi:hypothetical protein